MGWMYPCLQYQYDSSVQFTDRIVFALGNGSSLAELLFGRGNAGLGEWSYAASQNMAYGLVHAGA